MIMCVVSNNKSSNDSCNHVDLASKCLRLGFTPGHVLVNQERTSRGLTKLIRSPGLDRLAQLMAQQAATAATSNNNDTTKSNIIINDNNVSSIVLQQSELQTALGKRHVAQIVHVGESVHALHRECMQEDMRAKRELISFRYKEYGMGTARIIMPNAGNTNNDNKSKIVMVQLLRG